MQVFKFVSANQHWIVLSLSYVQDHGWIYRDLRWRRWFLRENLSARCYNQERCWHSVFTKGWAI